MELRQEGHAKAVHEQVRPQRLQRLAKRGGGRIPWHRPPRIPSCHKPGWSTLLLPGWYSFRSQRSQKALREADTRHAGRNSSLAAAARHNSKLLLYAEEAVYVLPSEVVLLVVSVTQGVLEALQVLRRTVITMESEHGQVDRMVKSIM